MVLPLPNPVDSFRKPSLTASLSCHHTQGTQQPCGSCRHREVRERRDQGKKGKGKRRVSCAQLQVHLPEAGGPQAGQDSSLPTCGLQGLVVSGIK